ncbi:Hypothetical predicted protein [Podarcis lilfordi]|uniref:DUF4614 domain-containing protein n=1 Tax=Podarcis lilfordi TaxID=74358 RepID=A0AA35LN05_9SAUR|nr:Hypothetical predicted protein [Podarcis lilfordi]
MAVRRAEGRSAALARAQAQLTGRRLTGREELDGAPRNRLAALEPSKSPGLSAIHMASDLSDLSDLGRRELEGASLAETPTPPQTGPRRRFVKQKPQEVVLDTQQARPSPATRTGFAAASRGERSSAVLRKLAQIESKIRSRKAGRDVGQAPTTDEEISLSDFSRSPEPRLGGRGSLGKAMGLKETAVPIRGSSQGGTEGRRQALSKESGEQEDLLGRKKWIRSPPSSRPRSPLPGKTFLKRPTPRSPSPPGKPPPARLSRGAFRSSTPAGSSSPDASSVPLREASLSERSVVRSLDELFLAVGGGPSDDDSSSSSDFRVNVLSLDDLAPAAASQTEVSGAAPAMPTESKEELGASLFAAVSQSPFKAQSPPRREAASLEEEEEEEETEEDDDPGDTEISERLNSTSAGSSHPEEEEEEEENPTSAEYSEDFESSAASGERPSSRDPSGAWAPSEHPASSSLTCPPGGARTTCLPARVLMKDAAVQTGRSSLAYCWLQGDAPAALGPTMGAESLLETPPIASHVVSLETLEALTTYSPAVFALNELLKQNVLLIRQFADATRQLHASWVASLEEERGFHYHTLEEAKEYIERHKPPPLTVEQALREELECRGQAVF